MNLQRGLVNFFENSKQKSEAQLKFVGQIFKQKLTLATTKHNEINNILNLKP